MAVTALPRLWATAAHMDEPYRTRYLGRNREGGERLRLGIKVETAGFACPFGRREAMLTSTDGTLIKPEFLGISVPACEGTKRQTDMTHPPYIRQPS
jgi:hypothetical protein